MKKSIILLAALTSMVVTGCYKLDLVPLDKPNAASFWQTEDQCKQGILGVYAGMKQDDIFGISFMLDVNSDIGMGYDQYEILQLGTATARTAIMNDKWKQGYDMIQRANTAIRNLEIAPIADAKKAQLIGETKFLRAMVYFHLMNYFGGLPIYDKTTDLEKEYNTLLKPRSTEAEVRAFILKDLSDALASGLPEKAWPADNYGRVTEGAVYALRGKVYLYDKKYDLAIADLEQVAKDGNKYGYKLYPSYADLFNMKGGHTSSEMIFSIINSGGVGKDYGLPLCFYAGTRAAFKSCWNNTMPSTTLADMYETKEGKPFDWEELFPGYNAKSKDGKNFYNDLRQKIWYAEAKVVDKKLKVTKYPAEKVALLAMYANRDPRFKATLISPYEEFLGWDAEKEKVTQHLFLKQQDEKTGKWAIVAGQVPDGFMRNNKGTNWETYFWRKFVPEGNWNGAINDRAHTPVNFPLIRLADVYLLLAEAYNEAGDQAAAVTYINKVRARTGVNMPAINSGSPWLAATSKEEVFQRIVKERGIELACEGHRDIDLRRWRLSEKLLEGPKYGITGQVVVQSKFNPNRDYLWPIPATEIEMNPSLVQNPGW